MKTELDFYLKDVVKNEIGASEEIINELNEQITFKLPEDYLELMKEFNGGEGSLGENSWLCLFPIEDLIMANIDYSLLMDQIPDYFLFGKDAADTGYAFHKNNQTIHSFGLMSNFDTDLIDFCGKSFSEFVEYLYRQ